MARGVRLRASYGEGFRAPSLGELYYPFFGNPQLQPETSRSWELGVAAEGGPWQLDVALFRTRERDLIDFDADFRSVNIGDARSEGVETTLRYRGDAVSGRLGATWLSARDLDRDVPLRRRAPRSGSLGVTWRRAVATFDAQANYVGPRPDTDPVTGALARVGGYLRLDLAVQGRRHRGISPYLRVENATDRAYDEALGFPAPGRRFIAGVELGW